MDISLIMGPLADAAVAVGVIIGAGVMVAIAWLIGRIATRGFTMFGDGGGERTAWDRVVASRDNAVYKSFERNEAKRNGLRRMGSLYDGDWKGNRKVMM